MANEIGMSKDDLLYETRNNFVMKQENNYLQSIKLPSYGTYKYNNNPPMNNNFPIDFTNNAPSNHRPYFQYLRPDLDHQDTYQPPFNLNCEYENVPSGMLDADHQAYISKEQYNKFNKKKFNGVGYTIIP
jgi:hypothetical protein